MPFPPLLRTLLLATAGLTAACQPFPPATIPMTARLDPCPPTQGPRVLLVLLPGRGDTPEDLLRRGMVRMVRERGIAADVFVADAHFGYYRARQAVARLWQDVVEPALARGYDGVWLAGLSIGALGALLAGAKEAGFPAEVLTGILAIAPVLTDDEAVVREIEAAGGLAAWQPPAAANGFSHRLPAWLRGFADPAAERPLLFLGCGTEDRFFRQCRLVAPLLPEERFLAVPGGHRWEPWLRIWALMLDRAPLPRLAP
ncbi:MAG: alpha/beta hydrolase [Planctomycetes bacterium]|nr:alpha/beta hydrolase [Planctomycetota bacterium]